MTWNVPDVLEEAQAKSAEFHRGVQTLASAIIKIAPSAAQLIADLIADRWKDVQDHERVALDEFLTFLKAHSLSNDATLNIPSPSNSLTTEELLAASIVIAAARRALEWGNLDELKVALQQFDRIHQEAKRDESR